MMRVRRLRRDEGDRPFILILSHLYPRPGAQAAGVFVQRYARALAAVADVAVVSIARREAGASVSKQLITGTIDGVFVVLGERAVPQVRGRLSGIAWLWSSTVGAVLAELQGVRLVFKQFGRPTVVNPHFSYPSALTAYVLGMIGLRYVVTEHSTEYASGRFRTRGRLTASLLGLALRHADFVTVVSHRLAQDMMSYGLRFNWVTIPNIIDVCPSGDRPTADRPVILSVSLMTDSTKNISGLLHAVASLRSGRQDFLLKLVGDGPDRVALESLATELEIDDVVHFTGLLAPEDVRDAMEGCAFLVTSSTVETFSVVTAEAIACGRPVVATRSGGPESFVDPMVGVLIDPLDEEDLEQALEYMLDHYQDYDPALLRAYAKSRFSAEVVVASFVRALENPPRNRQAQ